MIRISTAFSSKLASVILILGVGLSTGNAQQNSNSGLKTVDNPGGGQFVYGPLTGQSSQAAALVFMLHQVHNHFGDKPGDRQAASISRRQLDRHIFHSECKSPWRQARFRSGHYFHAGARYTPGRCPLRRHQEFCVL